MHRPCGRIAERNDSRGQRPAHRSVQSVTDDVRELCEKINSNIRFEKGLKKFDTDLKTKTVTITYDADKTDIEKLKEGFRKFHYEAEFVKESKQGDKK